MSGVSQDQGERKREKERTCTGWNSRARNGTLKTVSLNRNAGPGSES